MRRELPILFLLLLLGENAWAGEEKAVIPVLRNQNPLSLLHGAFVPESPAISDAGETRAVADGVWSNTYVKEDRDFLLDVESQVLTLSARHGLDGQLELGADLPLVWRGGGVLDSVVKEWDSALGFSNSRHRAEDDQYAIRGRKRNGETFDLDRDGFGFAPASAVVKYSLESSVEGELSLLGRMTIPAATTQYGTPGLDISAGILALEQTGFGTVQGGLGFTVVGDTDYLGIEYSPFRVEGFLGIGWRIWEQWILGVSMAGESKGVREVPQYPDGEWYMDISLGAELSEASRVAITLRENPINPGDTTDFSAGVRAQIGF